VKNFTIAGLITFTVALGVATTVLAISHTGSDIEILGTTYAITFGDNISATRPVPEPATMLLFGAGLAGLAGIIKRKKN